MKKNKKAMSLPLVMWLLIVLWLLAQSILEYIVPFSKDIKGVENSTRAYYQAESWVEEWLYFLKNRTDPKEEEIINYDWDLTFELKTKSAWNIIPKSWEWNSEFDKNWNRISGWNPVQIPIGNGYITRMWDFKIFFRVPDLNRDGSNEIFDTSDFSKPIINWQLSGTQNTLNSDNTLFKALEINWEEILMNNRNWLTLTNTSTQTSFSSFYSNNCSSWSECSLKLSVVNELKTSYWKIIPYLEWKITSTDNIPYYYTKLYSKGKSYWYRRDLDVLVPRETLIEAFDFTVFQ